MKSLGIVRKIDELGRIVIPKEIFKTKGIENGDSMEVFIEGDYIMLRHYEPHCTFCSKPNTVYYKGKHVCLECFMEIVGLFKDYESADIIKKEVSEIPVVKDLLADKENLSPKMKKLLEKIQAYK